LRLYILIFACVNLLDQKKQLVAELCELYGVDKLFAFGSAITEKFNDESDVDLLVDLEPMSPIKRGETLMHLWDDLEKVFGRRVDLLTEQSLTNRYLRENISRTKRLIYDRRNKKAA
jgi:predicted nucleotidyltransferase